MKHINYFKCFLEEVVNLNSGRIESLEKSIVAIENVIKDSIFNDYLVDFAKQGSWAHQTIIKPLPGKIFDADLVIILNSIPNWSAENYLDELKKVFKESHHHQDLLSLYSHCLTIEYAGDKNIDIAICIERDWGLEVCNKEKNIFEPSYPKEYTTWVKEQNKIVGGNDLIKATRIIKFLRDHKSIFTMPSFLLTTLIGLHIYPYDKEHDDFKDTPTSLKTLFNRINSYFQMHSFVPDIYNPKNVSNNLKELFGTQVQYDNLKKCWERYNNWINEAYIEEDYDKSIAKWQKLLGSEFAKSNDMSKSLLNNIATVGATFQEIKNFSSNNNNNLNPGSKNATG